MVKQNEKISLVDYTDKYEEICEGTDLIPGELFDVYGVKRGLRDKNGNGVLSGLTHISKIEAFKNVDGKKVPCDGKLWYRGYSIIDLVRGFRKNGSVLKRLRICFYLVSCRMLRNFRPLNVS